MTSLTALLAVDDFDASHRSRLEAALGTDNRLLVIDRFASETIYAEAMSNATFMIGWPDPDLIASSAIEILQLPSAGFDAYQRQDLRDRTPFIVCNARGVMSIAVAEHCLSLMLALVRNLPDHARDFSSATWQRRDRYDELYGASVCIVGLGDIGMEIAKRCAAFGMRIIGVRRSGSDDVPGIEQSLTLDELPDVLAEIDHLVLTIPATPETQGLLNAAMLDSMKPGARVYNLARGSLIDEVALIERLTNGHLAGAALDVFEVEPLPPTSSLWSLDNVIVTPHVAGRSVREFDRFCDLCVSNIEKFKRSDQLQNIVDL